MEHRKGFRSAVAAVTRNWWHKAPHDVLRTTVQPCATMNAGRSKNFKNTHARPSHSYLLRLPNNLSTHSAPQSSPYEIPQARRRFAEFLLETYFDLLAIWVLILWQTTPLFAKLTNLELRYQDTSGMKIGIDWEQLVIKCTHSYWTSKTEQAGPCSCFCVPTPRLEHEWSNTFLTGQTLTKMTLIPTSKTIQEIRRYIKRVISTKSTPLESSWTSLQSTRISAIILEQRRCIGQWLKVMAELSRSCLRRWYVTKLKWGMSRDWTQWNLLLRMETRAWRIISSISWGGSWARLDSELQICFLVMIQLAWI